jgi:hypothetical protein
MLISNLEYMEKVVDSRADLEWDGWDLVKYTRSGKSMFSSDGSYRNGKWFSKRIFPVTENGWNIPKSIGIIDEKMER